MADHKSALKRNRQNIKLREHNKNVRSAVKSAAAKATQSIKSQAATAGADLKLAIKALATAGRKGTIPKRRASRKASRLQIAMNKSAGTSASK